MFDGSPSAAGIDGLFDSVDSNPLTVIITDPCANSVVNSNGAFEIEDPFEVPRGDTERV